MSFSLLIGFRGDGGHRDRLFDWVQAWWQAHFDPEICIGSSVGDPFHRGQARNNAFLNSTQDVVVVADADTIPNPSAVAEALDMVTQAPWVLPYGVQRYYNLSETATELVLACDPRMTTIPEPSHKQAWEHQVTSWAGCLVMERAAFEEAGGYDERFVGWGYEDNAFSLALDAMVGPHARIESHLCHLWHPVTAEATFRQPMIRHNAALFRKYVGAGKRAIRMGEVLQR